MPIHWRPTVHETICLSSHLIWVFFWPCLQIRQPERRAAVQMGRQRLAPCSHDTQAALHPPLAGWSPLSSLELSKALIASWMIWVAGNPGRTLVLLPTYFTPGCSGLCSVGSWNPLQGWRLPSWVGLGCCWALDLKMFSAQMPSESIQGLKMKNIYWEPGMVALGDKRPRS